MTKITQKLNIHLAIGEDAIEQTTLEWLKNLGYEITSGDAQ